MPRKLLANLLLLTLVFIGCNTQPATQVERELDQQIQQHIDPEIQGLERQVIAEYMRTLPPEDWENVTYIKDGKIYVNRVRLKGLLEVAEPLGDGLYKTESGRIFAAPPEDNLWTDELELAPQVVTCTGNSGPFRRIASKQGSSTVSTTTLLTRFAYSYATLTPAVYTFDPVTLNQDSSTKEIPYAYLGGRGYTSATSFTEVDAGFQFAIDEYNWAIWLKVGSTLVTSTTRARYDPNNNVSMSFEVVSDGNIRLTVHSPSLTAGVPNPFPISAPAAGFKLNGTKNMFKRVTSIAQVDSSTNAQVTRVNTGAFFPVGWINTKLGLSSSSFHNWGQAGNDVDPNNNCVNPNTSKIQIYGLGSYTDEEVHINLQ